jgi:hypothetical protein
LSWTGHRIERLPHCRCYNESAYGSRLASVLGLSQPVDSGTAARKVSDQPSGSQEPDQAPQALFEAEVAGGQVSSAAYAEIVHAGMPSA